MTKKQLNCNHYFVTLYKEGEGRGTNCHKCNISALEWNMYEVGLRIEEEHEMDIPAFERIEQLKTYLKSKQLEDYKEWCSKHEKKEDPLEKIFEHFVVFYKNSTGRDSSMKNIIEKHKTNWMREISER